MNWRITVLLTVVAASIAAVFFIPAIPQNETYHNFADQRAFLGYPNFGDVVSNTPFLLVGVWGIILVARANANDGVSFTDPLERWAYLAFFFGVALTAFGSAYYHLHPDDDRLVWDRIPMAIAFMALLAAVVSERVNVTAGALLLVPLVIIGVASVVYWTVTQRVGRGDLRPYVLVQFGGMLAIALLLVLFPARYTRTFDFLISFAFYGAAKLLESADGVVFAAGRIVSGHTLKHLAAATSAYWILLMLQRRRPVTAAAQLAREDPHVEIGV
jgi:hypothetical protein